MYKRQHPTPYKNFRTVLKAAEHLAHKGYKLEWVFTIKFNTKIVPLYVVEASHRAEEAGARIIGLGNISRAKLLALLKTADIVVWPSVLESFGHPALEALWSGKPIVAADTPVNRELLQEDTFFFKPLDPTDCAAKIEDALHHAVSTSQNSKSAISQFTWEQHARVVLSILEGCR